MKKEILIALVCASLMLIAPFTVVARENKISSNLSEQPDVEGLVSQIRIVIDEILEKYGHIPMVSNLFILIQNALGLIGTIVFCIILHLLVLPLVILLFILLRFDIYSYGLFVIIVIILSYLDLNCSLFNFFNLKLPIKSIYTLSETNDCPCLQE